MGRKKLGDQARSKYLRVRVSPGELDELREAADGERMSDWARSGLLKLARKKKKKRRD